MLNNIYILRKVVEELQQFIGCKILDCYTNRLGILHFDIFDGKNLFVLNISLISEFEAIFLTNYKNKQKKNVYRQFPSILGEVIQQLEIEPNNRLIKIELINKILYIQIFGKSQNNAILTDKSDYIIDAHKNRRELISTKLQLPQPFIKSISEFPKDTKIIKAVSGSKFLFGRILANELLNRLKIDPNLSLSDFQNVELERLELESKKFAEEIQSSNHYYILQNSENNKILSPIKLFNFPVIIEQHSDLFSLTRRVFSDRITQYRFEKLYKTLIDIDEKYLQKYSSKLRRYQEIPNLLKIIEQYQKYTELLYSVPNLKQRGQENIEITDFEGNPVHIPLDAKFTIIENIEKYYVKIKKIKRDIQIIEKNHYSIIDEYNYHNRRLNKLKAINNYIDLKNFYKENLNFYKKSMQNIPKEISEKFRKFEISPTAILYVGKDSKNNDELTFGFGKPNDYWFHLRGGSGSHCILKFNGEGKPPKEVIEKSASIAAYYSSQRNGGYVPVIFTQRKYVRKPKGANPGSVVVAKEEVIMVEPRSYDEIK